MTKPLSGSRRRLLVGLSLLPFASFAKDGRMRRVFITGSTDGLGRGAAQTLIAEGHQVVLHARTKERAAALSDLAPKAAGVVIGDLASAAQTRSLAEQVNKLGRMDAVIHNAGIFREGARGNTPEGHAKVLAVNVLAPYMLTALIERPDRLVYLSSGMHRGGEGPLDPEVDGHETGRRIATRPLSPTAAPSRNSLVGGRKRGYFQRPNAPPARSYSEFAPYFVAALPHCSCSHCLS